MGGSSRSAEGDGVGWAEGAISKTRTPVRGCPRLDDGLRAWPIEELGREPSSEGVTNSSQVHPVLIFDEYCVSERWAEAKGCQSVSAGGAREGGSWSSSSSRRVGWPTD